MNLSRPSCPTFRVQKGFDSLRLRVSQARRECGAWSIDNILQRMFGNEVSFVARTFIEPIPIVSNVSVFAEDDAARRDSPTGLYSRKWSRISLEVFEDAYAQSHIAPEDALHLSSISTIEAVWGGVRLVALAAGALGALPEALWKAVCGVVEESTLFALAFGKYKVLVGRPRGK